MRAIRPSRIGNTSTPSHSIRRPSFVVARAVHSLTHTSSVTYSRREVNRMSGHRSKIAARCARTAPAPSTAASPAVWFWNTTSSV